MLPQSSDTYLFTKSSDMLNKNTLGVKKVRGQSEATCKQAGTTKSFDISWGQEVSYFIKKLLTPWMKYNSLYYCISFKELKVFW